MAERTAVVVGATGLVGSELVEQLLDDPDYACVVTIVRRTSGRTHDKLREYLVDFEDTPSWSNFVRGSVLFSALGTTLKAAGSQAAQHRVDYDYQFQAAQAAKENGIESLVLVSSTGASAKSSVFYLKMKGQLEDAILSLGLQNVAILRPGMLDGDRKEHRPGEKIGLALFRKVPAWQWLSKMRPVHAAIVARAARRAASKNDGTIIWEAKDIFIEGG